MSKLYVKTEAGHGGGDSGAYQAGIKEKDLTLDIDLKVYSALKRCKIRTQRVREADVTMTTTARVNEVKNGVPDICISNHVNSAIDREANGFEIWVSQYSDKKIANRIIEEFKKMGLNTRGVKTRKNSRGQDYYYMHRQTGAVEVILIEYGFLSNKKDREFLLIESNRTKLAEAVVRALCYEKGIRYIPPKKNEPTPIETPEKELFYRVQVGYYGEKKNAEDMLLKLNKQGFNAIIKTEKRG